MAKATKSKRQKPRETQIIEDPGALREKLSKTEDFLERNRKMVLVIGGIVVALIAAYILFRTYINNRNQTAQENMFQAVYYFESDSLNAALMGDGNNYGFLEIIDEYPLTEAANLSHFYAGVSYLNLGQFEEAITHLKKFRSKDYVLQARAYAAVGDAYMEQEQYGEAADYYDRAANYKPNQYFTPQYLMKGALAYELNNNLESAIANYEKVVNEYRESGSFQEARKHLARLRGLASR